MSQVPTLRRWWFLLVFIAAKNFSQGAEVLVYAAGRIELPVFVAGDASADEREAAVELVRVLHAMSGLDWQVCAEDQATEAGIFIGRTRRAVENDLLLEPKDDPLGTDKDGVGPDTFRIEIEPRAICIIGATPEGTRLAVNWFLQHLGGVRWYSPGDEGEVIPRRTSWSVAEAHMVQHSAFVSREMVGLEGREGRDWAEHNGLKKRINFSHALSEIFCPAVLDKNPEWRPLLGGARFTPLSVDDNRWQPNLALPAVAGFAAQKAKQSLKENPKQPSYSLGLNDTVRFDQSGETRKLLEPLKYFRNRPDYSPLVFTFMNRVAEQVSENLPHRYLGCLAYFWCENPPAFRVNPLVMPYVTSDRAMYFDHEYHKADLDLLDRWGRSGVRTFGLWDYAEGNGFLVPRLPCRAFAEAMGAGWRAGARGYFAEVSPRHGFDEFKLWMIAQLSWDPQRSFDALADDFFRGYYGTAALPMRQFFERCEALWMKQKGEAYWLKYYKQEDQALLFSAEECVKLRAMIDVAEAAAKNEPAVKRRVAQTSRAFAVTEAYVDFDAIRREIAKLAGDENQSLPAEETAVRLIGELAERRTKLEKVFADYEARKSPGVEDGLEAFLRNDPVPRVLWLAGLQKTSLPEKILKQARVHKNSAWWMLANFIKNEAMRGGGGTSPEQPI